jgi:hypothetical protein
MVCGDAARTTHYLPRVRLRKGNALTRDLYPSRPAALHLGPCKSSGEESSLTTASTGGCDRPAARVGAQSGGLVHSGVVFHFGFRGEIDYKL